MVIDNIAGQERYRAMTRQYYTGSHAAVLMYVKKMFKVNINTTLGTA